MRWAVYAELRLGPDSALLALVPDPARVHRALAHALGYAISHLEDEPPEAIRRALGPLRERLEKLGGEESDERSALERIARTCAAAIPGARLAIVRRLPVDQRAPLPPVALRSGRPPAEGPGIWPFDAELAGLRVGRRRLLLRESMSAHAAERDAAWLTSQGVAVRRVEREARPLLYAALDASSLEEAASRHADACREHAGWRDAVAWMGDALGYPRCCVEAFARVRRRDDVTLFAERLPPLPSPPASPLNVWLAGALALVSHGPCSLACAPTEALAAAVLAELDRATPGFAARWRALASRVHAVSADGRAFALAATGDLVRDGVLHVDDALELTSVADGEDVARVAAPFPALAGAELRVERGVLVAPAAPDWVATLVADHRGA